MLLFVRALAPKTRRSPTLLPFYRPHDHAALHALVDLHPELFDARVLVVSFQCLARLDHPPEIRQIRHAYVHRTARLVGELERRPRCAARTATRSSISPTLLAHLIPERFARWAPGGHPAALSLLFQIDRFETEEIRAA